MVKGFAHLHYLVVVLFFLIYVVKTVLLLSKKEDLLEKFTKMIKIPEMIVSSLFLLTGVFLMTQIPKIHYLLWIKLALIAIAIPVAVIGFKKSNKILASLSLLLITATFGIAEVASKKKMQANNDHVSDPKALYENNCALCHGNDGKLGAMGAKDLSATSMDAAGIKEVILHGQNMMQPVPVSEEQAGSIAEYVSAQIKVK